MQTSQSFSINVISFFIIHTDWLWSHTIFLQCSNQLFGTAVYSGSLRYPLVAIVNGSSSLDKIVHFWIRFSYYVITLVRYCCFKQLISALQGSSQFAALQNITEQWGFLDKVKCCIFSISSTLKPTFWGGGQFFLKFPKRHGAIVTICNNVKARSPLVYIPSINKILIEPYSIPSIVYNPAEQSQNVGANLCLCSENNSSQWLFWNYLDYLGNVRVQVPCSEWFIYFPLCLTHLFSIISCSFRRCVQNKCETAGVREQNNCKVSKASGPYVWKEDTCARCSLPVVACFSIIPL